MENDYQSLRIAVGIASITWCLSPNDGGGNCMARFAASWGDRHALARQKECQIIEGHVMPDHVHMCIAIPPR